jgi:hypothetical protein
VLKANRTVAAKDFESIRLLFVRPSGYARNQVGDHAAVIFTFALLNAVMVDGEPAR